MRATAAIATAATLATASAFVAPCTNKAVSTRTSTSNVNMARQDLEAMDNGATAPVPYWDPLGLANAVDDEELQKYREAELKHGRVAMLAALGMIVQEAFHPLFPFADPTAPIGPASFHLQEVNTNYPLLPLALVTLIAAVEARTINKGWSKSNYKEEGLGAGFVANLKDDYFPGDLGFDPLGLYPDDAAGRTNMRNKELNNGRLAMIATIGIWAQELVDKNTLGGHFALHGLGPAVAETPLEQASQVAQSLSN